MSAPPYIRRAVRRRINACLAQRETALRAALHPRGPAEKRYGTAVRGVEEKVAIDLELAERSVKDGGRGQKTATLRLSRTRSTLVTVELGDTTDFLPIVFLEQGRTAADAVGRVLVDEDLADGTCFMISSELLITARHVIKDESEAAERFVQFNFEEGGRTPRVPTRFALNPDPEKGFFLASKDTDLDYAVIALGERVPDDPEPVPALGSCPLVAAHDRMELRPFLNIIQHQNGEAKSIVIRENRLIAQPGAKDRVLHYEGDTSEMSSGAPVFDDDWNVVALHHDGLVSKIITPDDGPQIFLGRNEGIRVSAIVADLVQRKGELSPAAQTLLRRALGTQFDAPLV
jgi:endonuclease G